MSLDPTDFEVLTPTVSATANEIRIKLSASGIEKVKTAAAGQVSEYTLHSYSQEHQIIKQLHQKLNYMLLI
ncbi:hypothetical protein [Brachyspira intermedia]|uniref:hypothetical protein n=1 Tax=Brachyspira intermedia TaxID=84377 RepID=UPI0030055CCF